MKSTIAALLFVFILTVPFSTIHAQNNESNFKFKGFGLSLGVYEPELDYWKNDESSLFRKAEYSDGIMVQGFAEFRLIKNFSLRLGVGYWEKRAETRISKFGFTTMVLSGVPVSLDLVYYIDPLRVAVVTPFIGVGGEYLMVQHTLNFEGKEDPDPVRGATGMVSGMFGLQTMLSKNFSADIYVQYKAGAYQQNFIREVINPEDPSAPASEIEVTEDVSLTGPAFGLTLRYVL